jgi:hypothetical protein
MWTSATSFYTYPFQREDELAFDKRSTDNTMTKRKGTKGQTTIYKTYT